MDAQDFRSLQESYSQVYQDITEAKIPGDDLFKQLFRGKKTKGLKTNQPGQNKYLAMQNAKRSAARYAADMGRDRTPSYSDMVPEEVDIYDIILSHLLDEGYAETPEAAEAIMVNMSEEWRQSIIG